ncbi:hypothetical protein H5410_050565 [Solanum commersonii]|uniref:Uncharacterized protein n=1 Tax=Solanum commersonii TaxID=4109 RepID=A0A9J5WVW8_SOLCO|nr:hypothetical protein H5410_050565 [Solanum commersonii]
MIRIYWLFCFVRRILGHIILIIVDQSMLPLVHRKISISTPSPTGTSPQLSAMRVKDFSSE